ncbi:MAG TPA: hypothetical protein VKC60_08345 [Opitutaceae bacterium]|nr:hypothetical protein [Opitutaceae bacterium]
MKNTPDNFAPKKTLNVLVAYAFSQMKKGVNAIKFEALRSYVSLTDDQRTQVLNLACKQVRALLERPASRLMSEVAPLLAVVSALASAKPVV